VAQDATIALVLGLLGWLVCPICAPFAWSFGSRALQQIDIAGGALGGRGLAVAGKYLGLVMTVLMTIAIVVALVFFLPYLTGEREFKIG